MSHGISLTNNTFFNNTISDTTIGEISKTDTAAEAKALSIWEKIKDLIFGTDTARARELLFDLTHAKTQVDADYAITQLGCHVKKGTCEATVEGVKLKYMVAGMEALSIDLVYSEFDTNKTSHLLASKNASRTHSYNNQSIETLNEIYAKPPSIKATEDSNKNQLNPLNQLRINQIIGNLLNEEMKNNKDFSFKFDSSNINNIKVRQEFTANGSSIRFDVDFRVNKNHQEKTFDDSISSSDINFSLSVSKDEKTDPELPQQQNSSPAKIVSESAKAVYIVKFNSEHKVTEMPEFFYRFEEPVQKALINAVKA